MTSSAPQPLDYGPRPPSHRRRRYRYVPIVAAAIVLAVLLGLASMPFLDYRRNWNAIKAKQRTMLYQIDHQELFDVVKAAWQKHPYSTTLPSSLGQLQPHSVFPYDSGLSVEMGGQGCHYGFEFYFDDPAKDDIRSPCWTVGYPCKELMPGLWYYAENGIVGR